MSGVKQCSICKVLYKDYELETVFTGRRKLVCSKCMARGQRQTGELLHNHYTRFANNGGKK